ncbi:MAG: sulfite exporter TauE/SafE family protein [Armatimonadaceae bacterium]
MMNLPAFNAWEWAMVYLAAFCVGLAKTGIPGVGIVAVALFPLLLPPREAVGSVLLVLIGADILAVLTYRREAEWKSLWKLFPGAALGVVLGSLAMGRLRDSELTRLIGIILLLLVALQFWQRWKARQGKPDAEPTMPLWLSAAAGITAGFTTMIANAAGPVMIIYLLAMRLPKVAFVATAAWFFFVINLFKVPFSIHLGGITKETAKLALVVFPGALVGGLVGRTVLKKIDQRLFEWLALLFTLAAGIKLVL